MSSTIHDFGITLSSKIAVVLISIGIQSSLAWILGPSGRGSYAVCIIFASLLSLIFVIGYDIAVTYFVASKKISISEGIIYSFLYGGIGSALAIFAGLIAMTFPLAFFSKASTQSFHLSLISIPISLFSYTFLQLFTAIQQFGWYAILIMTNAVTQFLFTILFIWIFSWGVDGAILSIIANGTLTIIITLALLHAKYHIRWSKPTIRKLRGMFSYGARYYIGKISNTVNFQLGTIILALFASNREIAFFVVAASSTARVMIVPDTLITILIPRASRDKMGRKDLIAQCARFTAIICGLLLLFLVVFTKEIVIILFSSSFLSAVVLIRILAIGIFVRSICKVFVPFLLGTNRPGIASFSVATGTIVNLTLLLLLLPIMGLIGAAISMTISYFISSAILLISFWKLSGLSLTKIFRFGHTDWNLIIESIHRIPI